MTCTGTTDITVSLGLVAVLEVVGVRVAIEADGVAGVALVGLEGDESSVRWTIAGDRLELDGGLDLCDDVLDLGHLSSGQDDVADGVEFTGKLDENENCEGCVIELEV
ncbi:hypothetical protein AB1Y20_005874 [Prymnesium parvum]|uniref:Uncharacterized protein n=1 Tax=Prymnesium parvum TaxID=97485 RepID=A0AB34J2G3_PRYPA